MSLHMDTKRRLTLEEENASESDDNSEMPTSGDNLQEGGLIFRAIRWNGEIRLLSRGTFMPLWNS